MQAKLCLGGLHERRSDEGLSELGAPQVQSHAVLTEVPCRSHWDQLGLYLELTGSGGRPGMVAEGGGLHNPLRAGGGRSLEGPCR